jgi:small subunit ribosomal protein S2
MTRIEREENGLVDLKELIRAGVHFGHRTSRWNPKMSPYILKKRNLIHIIDLRQTVRGLVTAKHLAEAVSQRGEYVLFVGTKRQARDIIKAEAERCNMPYVCERWPGGLLTNYATIRQRLERLVELENLDRTGEINRYSKKMISSLRREQRKINRNLGGVRNMKRLPGLLVVVDPQREHLAVKEGAKLAIPTIAWTDTDGDPSDLDVCVPANDDAIGSIQIFARTMADAVLTGTKRRQATQARTAMERTEGAGEKPEVKAAQADAATAAAQDQPVAEGAGAEQAGQ